MIQVNSIPAQAHSAIPHFRKQKPPTPMGHQWVIQGAHPVSLLPAITLFVLALLGILGGALFWFSPDRDAYQDLSKGATIIGGLLLVAGITTLNVIRKRQRFGPPYLMTSQASYNPGQTVELIFSRDVRQSVTLPAGTVTMTADCLEITQEIQGTETSYPGHAHFSQTAESQQPAGTRKLTGRLHFQIPANAPGNRIDRKNWILWIVWVREQFGQDVDETTYYLLDVGDSG